MNCTMIISTPDPEIIWNAFRLGNLMLNNEDEVNIFLNGPAVDYTRGDSNQYPVKEQAKIFTLSEGSLTA